MLSISLHRLNSNLCCSVAPDPHERKRRLKAMPSQSRVEACIDEFTITLFVQNRSINNHQAPSPRALPSSTVSTLLTSTCEYELMFTVSPSIPAIQAAHGSARRVMLDKFSLVSADKVHRYRYGCLLTLQLHSVLVVIRCSMQQGFRQAGPRQRPACDLP
jgi:hypothetical protein